MKKNILVLLFLLLGISVFAQGSFHINSTQIRFFLKPVLFNNLKLKHYGEKILQSNPTVTGEAGFGIKQRLYENYSVIIDVGYTVTFFQFKYDFVMLAKSSSANQDYYNSEKYIAYMSSWVVFPVSIQYETLWNKKLNYFVELGIKINMQPYPEEAGMPGVRMGIEYDTNNIFCMNMEAIPRVIVSCFVKAGIVFTSPKTHSFNLSLVVNYSPKPAYKGDYQFIDVPFQSYGDVSMGLNYIGLEFVYGLSVRKTEYLPSKNYPN